MLKYILIPVFAVSFTAVLAQTDNDPYRAISKDVQKIQLRNQLYQPSILTTALELPTSKGIAALQQRDDGRKPATVRTEGIPARVISKDVARLRYQREKK